MDAAPKHTYDFRSLHSGLVDAARTGDPAAMDGLYRRWHTAGPAVSAELVRIAANGIGGDKNAGAVRGAALSLLATMDTGAGDYLDALLALLDDDTDEVAEELPYAIASAGEAAIEPLREVLLNPTAGSHRRSAAACALSQIGEVNPRVRQKMAALLTDVLEESGDPELNGWIVSCLLDLGAANSLAAIERAYEAARVNIDIVSLDDVREVFDPDGLDDDVLDPTVAVVHARGPRHADAEFDEDYTRTEPYSSPPGVGRNEACPCGSGLKYKKCCGR